MPGRAKRRARRYREEGAAAYRTLGIGYLGVAIARVGSMFADGSVERSNVISLAVQIVSGVVLGL